MAEMKFVHGCNKSVKPDDCSGRMASGTGFNDLEPPRTDIRNTLLGVKSCKAYYYFPSPCGDVLPFSFAVFPCLSLLNMNFYRFLNTTAIAEGRQLLYRECDQ